MRAWFGLPLAVGVASGCAGGFDDYQADPFTVAPPSSPNWAFAAPEGIETAATPTIASPVFAIDQEALLTRLDAAAAAEDRVATLTPAWEGADPSQTRAYVQRSALFGFPDVVSVAAVDLSENGAARASIAIYSRSVYGYSDLGVNSARVSRWLDALGDAAPAER